MARRIYVQRDGEWVEVTNQPREVAPRCHIITDSMSDTLHPADGNYYSSKSAYRRATKENGCEEVGNEKIDRKSTEYQPREVKEDILRAINDVEQGRGFNPSLSIDQLLRNE